jgi:TonB family protein
MSQARRFRASAAVLAVLTAMSAGLAGQDPLSEARDLYAGAAYEQALLLLDRLRAEAKSDDVGAIEQYRAFCFLALGRSADAEAAIEAVVHARPSYQPSATDLSPRLRTAFSDVRRRVLPAIVQQKYAAAKAAYDRKDWVEAESTFKQVLEVLHDPDLAPLAGKPPLSDLRTLASGFHDLSVAAAAPPPPPPPPPAPPVEPPPAPVVAGPPPIYVASDTGVTPPVTLRQFLPAFPTPSSAGPAPIVGSIEVVISEDGTVESAVMKVPLQAAYDRQALQAARTWQYKPATLNGVPVKFRKVVQISVQR